MLENQHCQGLLAPVPDALPPELLTTIFALACTHPNQDEESTPQTPNHPPTPMTLSHVCSSWRGVALETPSLWTLIQLSNLSQLPFVTYMLERSQDRPVSVVFYAHFTREQITPKERVFRTILSNNQRLESLELMLPHYLLQHVVSQACGVLEELKTLKIINGPAHTFACYPASTLPNNTISALGGPKLERIEVVNYRLPWTSKLLRRPRLTHLKLGAIPCLEGQPSPTLFDFLRESPQLVSLDLQYPFLSNTGVSRSRIPLPNIKVLKLDFPSYLTGLLSLLKSLLLPPPEKMSEVSFATTLGGETNPGKAESLFSAWREIHQEPTMLYPKAFTINSWDDSYHGSTGTVHFYIEVWTKSYPDPLWPVRGKYQEFGASRPRSELSFHLIRAALPFTFPLYQGPWSFDNLRVIEVYGWVSLSFWTLLGGLPLLEAVYLLAAEVEHFIHVVRGTFPKPTDISVSPFLTITKPFSALRSLAIRELSASGALHTIGSLIDAFSDRLPTGRSEESFLETLCMRPTVPQDPPTLHCEMYSGGRFARKVLWERTPGVVTPLNSLDEGSRRANEPFSAV
ncbi:hypothetical protein FA13DRAFT_1451164 [Coprinellus micaceus]|uniref:Uncharacterized protein n=1 Tax=Coprinellus micaceus TaxID=71717 RepID=A0A4Y7TM36_COPMI|nr:hypothetical protein FA13DRAFT_1451164 [Coprinellus micaceus]